MNKDEGINDKVVYISQKPRNLYNFGNIVDNEETFIKGDFNLIRVAAIKYFGRRNIKFIISHDIKNKGAVVKKLPDENI